MIRVELNGKDVIIYTNGLDLIKLKAKLSQAIGSNLLARTNSLSFPSSCLPQVVSLIGPENISGGIADELATYDRHKHARLRASSYLEGYNDTPLPGEWDEILEPAQAKAVLGMVEDGLLGLCLFDEQGSGKTVMTIAAYDVLRKRNEVDAMIVVCPKSMIGEWPKDLSRFLGDGLRIEVAQGTKQQKFNAAFNDFDVLISNYEGINPMLVPLAASAVKKRFLLVVDESYYAKNEDSQRSELLRDLRRHCVRCFVLCGTPAPNSAHDLINQFSLADLGYTFGGFSKSKEPNDDWDDISRLIEERGTFIRRLKTEILDFVPVKNFHVIQAEMKGKQSLMYETARRALELELRTLSNDVFRRQISSYFQKRNVLLQICCCPSAIDPTLNEVPAKYTELDRLIKKLSEENRKVIIWSFYKKSIDEIMLRYESYNPVRVDGSVSVEGRKEAVSLFQNNPNVRIFIGNPAAAGAGITLHSAYDAIYLSYSNQAAHYLQSLDRIHRRGQISAEVNYYLIICGRTIEETEVKRLRSKEIRQHDLLGDNVKWPSSLDEALSELTDDV